MPNFRTVMKEQKEHDSFMEFARLKDDYLFDEVAVKNLSYQALGVVLEFTYTRHGVTLKDLQPLTVTTQEFSEARAEAENNKSKFAETRLVARLFADGARQYNARSQQVEENFLKDIEFIEGMKH